MIEMSQHLDWADTKYRPKSFPEIVGNDWAVKKIREFADNMNFPHLVFPGPPGVGKSCCAEILAKATNAEIKCWNASDERGIAVIRKEVKPFARSKSMDKPFKIAFMDECEKLTSDAQDAARWIMEHYSYNCKFILATNNLASLEDYITSKCAIIRFGKLNPEDIFKRLSYIAEQENSPITREQLWKIANNSYGDMRRAIKVLQSLCERRKTPVTDDDINMSLPSPDVQAVGRMLTLAFEGQFSEAIRLLDDICYRNTPEAIYKVIEQEFQESKFSENQKAVIAAGLGNLPPGYALGEKKHMFGFIAFIYQNRRETG